MKNTAINRFDFGDDLISHTPEEGAINFMVDDENDRYFLWENGEWVFIEKEYLEKLIYHIPVGG